MFTADSTTFAPETPFVLTPHYATACWYVANSLQHCWNWEHKLAIDGDRMAGWFI